jgi:hypothetical protein
MKTKRLEKLIDDLENNREPIEFNFANIDTGSTGCGLGISNRLYVWGLPLNVGYASHDHFKKAIEYFGISKLAANVLFNNRGFSVLVTSKGRLKSINNDTLSKQEFIDRLKHFIKIKTK